MALSVPKWQLNIYFDSGDSVVQYYHTEGEVRHDYEIFLNAISQGNQLITFVNDEESTFYREKNITRVELKKTGSTELLITRLVLLQAFILVPVGTVALILYCIDKLFKFLGRTFFV